jgi:RNA polymerase sigma-70 factor, ECF subfamily
VQWRISAAKGNSPTIMARVSADAAAPQSLDRFLAGVERRALRMAQLGTRDADEAMDCVQDAMLQLARHYAGRDPAEWPLLFYRILDNRLRKWRFKQVLRGRWLGVREQAVDAEVGDPLDAMPGAEANRPDTALNSATTLLLVRRALEKLPSRQRQAFLLRHWQGLSTTDTAAAMGCSEGSVKTHLSRACASLRIQLQREGLTP